MYIQTYGSGPDLVMIHGWGLHGGIFTPLAELLASSFRLHLVDLPGHGYSHDDPVPLALDTCVNAIVAEVPEAIWLGWSMGGLFAIHAADTLPSVRGLILVASTPKFVRSADWPNATEPRMLVQFRDDLQRDYGATLDRFLALDTLGSEHAQSKLRTMRAALAERGAPAPAALQAGLQLLEDTDLRPRLPTLKVPNLWLSGRRDRQVASAAMRAAADMTPWSRFFEVPGGGHAPFLGQTATVAEQILAAAGEMR
ncbi:MAG: pimeloyl-ACP methyl ester esterase BioH [Xanthomonadaceae bacterium]|jgi:pimeloyl-[acyl-carrier protein] methyl ester esterase|nr:pimeloyl-ACP methyl ester esterase BioH [Xanthomonadaceae bacterium]